MSKREHARFSPTGATLIVELVEYLLEQLTSEARTIAVHALIWTTIAAILAIIFRLMRGANLSFFGLGVKAANEELANLKLKHNTLKLKFSELNADARQKNNALRLLHDIVDEIRLFLWGIDVQDDRDERLDKLYNTVLDTVRGALTPHKSNRMRIAVLVECEDGKGLRIIYCSGFSHTFVQSRRLGLHDTIAGKVFRDCIQYYAPDVEKDKVYKPAPNSGHTYRSLACTPILTNSTCSGVLSIDAQDKQSFDKSDLELMELFADILSMLFFVRAYYNVIEAATYEEAEG